MPQTVRYEDDIVAWSCEQARLLRAGRLDLLDLNHIAEEIEDVGKSEQRELASRMSLLLCHLLNVKKRGQRLSLSPSDASKFPPRLGAGAGGGGRHKSGRIFILSGWFHRTMRVKWQHQPERRGSSWQRAIREQRRALMARLERTPSLKTMLNDGNWWQEIWADAVADAASQTGLDQFPDACPWSLAEILAVDWLPE